MTRILMMLAGVATLAGAQPSAWIERHGAARLSTFSMHAVVGELTLPLPIGDFAPGAGLFASVTTNPAGGVQATVWSVGQGLSVVEIRRVVPMDWPGLAT